jgi:hypothetical protein
MYHCYNFIIIDTIIIISLYCSKNNLAHVDHKSQQLELHKLLEVQMKTQSFCIYRKHVAFDYNYAYSLISFEKKNH